jgi:uncharacterized protein (TIGR02569 family)
MRSPTAGGVQQHSICQKATKIGKSTTDYLPVCGTPPDSNADTRAPPEMTVHNQVLPAAEVLTAFGVGGVTLTPLPGGQRAAWRAGQVVLKPLDTDARELAWVETISAAFDGRSDFRVAPPLRSISGELEVGGWTAWRYEAGAPMSRSWRRSFSWRDVIDVSDAFHQAIAPFPRPAFLNERRDRWAIADRLAWRAATEPWGIALGRSRSFLDGLFEVMGHLKPIEATPQLIHGDLTGNVLFVDNEPPCVIDFSPYWRPATAAIAIVVIDALTFHRPGPSLIDSQMYRRDFGQYLLRALIFRMAADAGRFAGAGQDSDPDGRLMQTFRAVLRAAF